MKKLIEYLNSVISKQIKNGCTNIIRVESFDNPEVYRRLCETLSNSKMIGFV